MAQPKIVVTAKIVFETVAFHEIGHALVAMALPGTDRVHKISIIPRGIRALGCTIQRPIEDRYLMARDEMECKVAVLLGGWAAEMLVFGKPSTGAAAMQWSIFPGRWQSFRIRQARISGSPRRWFRYERSVAAY